MMESLNVRAVYIHTLVISIHGPNDGLRHTYERTPPLCSSGLPTLSQILFQADMAGAIALLIGNFARCSRPGPTLDLRCHLPPAVPSTDGKD